MEKEKVLEFEIIKINNFGIIGMLKQNTRILKRNMDTEYSRSYNFPSWDFINKKLYTYGDEKYGIPKRWRAEEGGIYWFIDSDFTGKVRDLWDRRSTDENVRYNLGNYFKTKEEAEKVRAGEIGGDE